MIPLKCESMSAGYSGLPVLRGIDLEVRAGEVVALLGPNGAGKSTALAAIAGLIPLMDGTVELLNERVRAGRPHLIARRGLAFVPDDRALFPGLTVRDNLRLAMGGRGGRAAEQMDRVLAYFPALGPLMNRRAGLMSGGEQQMLAISRAMATEPQVLMVDELSLGLAPVVVQSLMPIVRRLADDLGMAILIVEQHVDAALAIADRAYVLTQGQITMTGSASELLRQRDVLQASYLGEAAFEALGNQDGGRVKL